MTEGGKWRCAGELTGRTEPVEITATLGSRRPILLNHLVAPFALEGEKPGGVWGLGHEFEAHDVDAGTVSVVPDNEVLEVAKVGHRGRRQDHPPSSGLCMR